MSDTARKIGLVVYTFIVIVELQINIITYGLRQWLFMGWFVGMIVFGILEYQSPRKKEWLAAATIGIGAVYIISVFLYLPSEIFAYGSYAVFVLVLFSATPDEYQAEIKKWTAWGTKLGENSELRKWIASGTKSEGKEGSVLKGLGIALSGLQVDAWGAYVPERGGLAPEIKKQAIEEMDKRGLSWLTIAPNVMLGVGTRLQALTGEKRSHIIFQQGLAGGTEATVALRVAKRGKSDLELSWRLFESNVARGTFAGLGQGTLIVLGGLWILISLFLIPIGVGLCMLIPGMFVIGTALGWWGKNIGKTKATALEQLDSRMLAQSVNFSLMKTLDKLGISSDEVREVLASNMEGIGKLG